MGKSKAPARFELAISCLLDRRFNQLSHGAGLRKQALDFGLVFHVFLQVFSYCSRCEKKLKSWSPNVGLEPTTLRLRVSCSTD